MDTPTKEDKAREQKWKAEQDIRTLVDAKEIQNDKPRFKRAMAMAKEQMKTLKDVQAED